MGVQALQARADAKESYRRPGKRVWGPLRRAWM